MGRAEKTRLQQRELKTSSGGWTPLATPLAHARTPLESSPHENLRRNDSLCGDWYIQRATAPPPRAECLAWHTRKKSPALRVDQVLRRACSLRKYIELREAASSPTAVQQTRRQHTKINGYSSINDRVEIFPDHKQCCSENLTNFPPPPPLNRGDFRLTSRR